MGEGIVSCHPVAAVGHGNVANVQGGDYRALRAQHSGRGDENHGGATWIFRKVCRLVHCSQYAYLKLTSASSFRAKQYSYRLNQWGVAAFTESPGTRPDGSSLPPLLDAYTIHSNSMDSGYVSALASNYEKGVSNIRNDILASTVRVEAEDCDAGTVYSQEGSITGDKLDIYKSELVDGLVEQIRKLQTTPEILERIFKELPLLLKQFALRLGQPGSSKAERDVMYFVHKYRQ